MVIFFFLDYDGTLLPIARTPGEANIPEETRALLAELAGVPHFRLAMVSGRMVRDLKSKLRLNNVIYAGNHGLEIEGPGIRFRGVITKQYLSLVRKLKRKAETRLGVIPGVVIEDKTASFSVHYRLVSRRDFPAVRRIFNDVTRSYAGAGRITVLPGKKVYEIRPPVKWDKGSAVRWLLDAEARKSGARNILPVFIGDDVADESAFKVVRKKGLAVHVGKRRSGHADCNLDSPRQVLELLMELAAAGKKAATLRRARAGRT